MEAGVTTTATESCRSILDKPLGQLTEEDISQLTREDCRKFLKEKGMRRPSWNKSQAIQQVISLKALLESNDDSGAGALRKILVIPPPIPQSVPPAPENAWVASNSGDSVKEAVFVEEKSPYRRKAPPVKPVPVEEMNGRGGDTDNKNLSPRSPCEKNELGGQMTVFYCGKVNVYDGVPLDKARAIMHLAATPIDFPLDNQSSGNAALRSFMCHFQAAGENNGLMASNPINPHSMQTEKMAEYQQQFREKGNITRDRDVDVQVNRKLSLQRYLEKRKDRGRVFKVRKNTGQTSSTLEMYLNQQIRSHNSNGQSSRSSTASPTESGMPHAVCSSADNQAKFVNLSVDLNDESVHEH